MSDWINSVELAKVAIFVVAWWAGRRVERAAWRRGAKSKTSFAIDGKIYFAAEITEDMLDEKEGQ